MELDVADVLCRRPCADADPPTARRIPGPAHFAAERIRGAAGRGSSALPRVSTPGSTTRPTARRWTATADFVARLTRCRRFGASARDDPLHGYRRLDRARRAPRRLGAGENCFERHHAIVRRELARFRGRELDTAGDGFFAVVRRASPRRPGRRGAPRRRCGRLGIEIRAGLHTGECEVQRRQDRRDRASRSARASRRSRRPARSSSRAPSRISSPAPACASKTAASGRSRACRSRGTCSRSSRPDLLWFLRARRPPGAPEQQRTCALLSRLSCRRNPH